MFGPYQVYQDKGRRDLHMQKAGLERMRLPDALLVHLHAVAEDQMGHRRDQFLFDAQANSIYL